MIFCLYDKEERVRFAGAEYLFLTAKAVGDVILIKLDQLFDGLMKIILDIEE